MSALCLDTVGLTYRETLPRNKMHILDNATLLPARRMAPRGPLRFFTRYGLYDGAGRPWRGHPILISLKSSWPLQARRLPQVETRAVTEPAIYAGMIFGWFGHFITESLPNLLAVAGAKRAHPEARILAHAHGGFDPAAWKLRYARHLDYAFDTLGLHMDELTFVQEPLRVDRLILPDAPFSGKFSYTPGTLARIDATWPAPADPTRHLYLSRTRYTRDARITNEAEVEAHFAERGFEIVHLQDHDLPDQIDLIRGARVIAGPNGSALHWSLYAQDCTHVLSLGYGSRLQRGICRSRGQAYRELRGLREKAKGYRAQSIRMAELDQVSFNA